MIIKEYEYWLYEGVLGQNRILTSILPTEEMAINQARAKYNETKEAEFPKDIWQKYMSIDCISRTYFK